MIKIQKGAEPQILKDNKDRWTQNLLQLVKKYGTYEAIPKKEKEEAVKYYAHPDILSALIGKRSNAKCIYCESYVNVTGYANIEHYHPKSKTPKETFDWDNLFIGCSLCNTPKSDFDTSKEPFIHPVADNPEDYLTFDDLMYIPKASSGPTYQKARNVIDHCKLERIPLTRKHAEIQFAFMANREALNKKLDLYKSRKNDRSKLQDAADILTSLIDLNKEASDDAEYAGYMRYLLRKYDVIKSAVAVINAHKDDLGIPAGFQWSFTF